MQKIGVPAFLLTLLTVTISAPNSGCVPQRGAIVADHNARVERAKQRALASLAALSKEQDAAIEAVSARWTLIFPVCDDDVPPGAPCGLLATTYMDDSFQRSFVDARCGENRPSDVSCSSLFFEDFRLTLQKRYHLDADEYCGDGACTSLVAVELLLLQAHNKKVREGAQRALQDLSEKFDARRNYISKKLESELAAIDDGTSARLADAERTREALLAVAASMQTSGQALASAPPPTYTYVPRPAQSNTYAPQQQMQEDHSSSGCSSDFECGSSRRCMKDSGAFRGICAQTVTEFGTPTFQPPRAGSVGVGQGNCSFDTECSIGFKCVKTSGGLRGNCLR